MSIISLLGNFELKGFIFSRLSHQAGTLWLAAFATLPRSKQRYERMNGEADLNDSGGSTFCFPVVVWL